MSTESAVLTPSPVQRNTQSSKEGLLIKTTRSSLALSKSRNIFSDSVANLGEIVSNNNHSVLMPKDSVSTLSQSKHIESAEVDGEMKAF